MLRQHDEISVAQFPVAGLRHFANIKMFECMKCGRWMYGRWKMGEPVPSDVLMHVESHKLPPEKSQVPPYAAAIRELLDMIATAHEGTTAVSVLHDGKMTTGVSMRARHWYAIKDLAAKIKNQ